jgi:hypothetical protein
MGAFFIWQLIDQGRKSRLVKLILLRGYFFSYINNYLLLVTCVR